jgi:hypothetical protein
MPRRLLSLVVHSTYGRTADGRPACWLRASWIDVLFVVGKGSEIERWERYDVRRTHS